MQTTKQQSLFNDELLQKMQLSLFYCHTSKKHFTINIHTPYTTNDGRIAYPLVGQSDVLFTENALFEAMNTGVYKHGLSHFIKI